MDLSPPFVHPPRYVPLPLPPPPPPPSHPFPENPHNLRNSDHHNLTHPPLRPPQPFLPPPPPLPPAQHSYLPPPPSPPSYPRPQFTYLNNSRSPRHHTLSPRVSNQTLVDDDYHRHHHPEHHRFRNIPEFEIHYPDHRRFDLPENRFPYPPGFDHETPVPPYRPNSSNEFLVSREKIRRESENNRGNTSFRSREEYDYDDGYRGNSTRIEEFVYDRREDDNYRSKERILSSSRGFPRDFAYDHRDHRENFENSDYWLVNESELVWDGRGELVWDDRGECISRRSLEREFVRDDIPDRVIRMSNTDISDSDEFGFLGSDFNPEIEKSRGSREVTQEYAHIPPSKTLQRKSVLQRIQMGKSVTRNKHGERYRSSAYFEDASFKKYGGKDSFASLDQRVEEEREGSPVELDVSFKSNALVAKAIVTPPSPMVISDSSLTPKASMVKKCLLTDRDVLSSQSSRSNEIPTRLDSSRDVANGNSTSGKEMIQSLGKKTGSPSGHKQPRKFRKVLSMDSGKSPVKLDTSSHMEDQALNPSNNLKLLKDQNLVSSAETVQKVRSEPVIVLSASSKPALSTKSMSKNKGDYNNGPIKASAVIRKKKKVVATRSPLHCIQTTQKHNKPLNAVGSALSKVATSASVRRLKYPKERTDSAITSYTEKNMPSESGKKCESRQTLTSEKKDAKVGYRTVSRKVKRKRSSMMSSLSSSHSERGEFHKGSIIVDSPINVVDPTFGSQVELTTSVTESDDKLAYSDNNSCAVSNQLSPNDLILHKTGIDEGSAVTMIAEKDHDFVGFLKSANISDHEIRSAVHSDKSPTRSPIRRTVSESVSEDAVLSIGSHNQVTILVNDIGRPTALVEDSAILVALTAEEGIITESPVVDNNLCGIGTNSNSNDGQISDSGSIDIVGMDTFPGAPSLLSNGVAVEGSAVTMMSNSVFTDSSVENISENVRKRGALNLEVNLYRPQGTDISLEEVHVAGTAHSKNLTSSCPTGDHNMVIKEVAVSEVYNSNAASLPCSDAVLKIGSNSKEGIYISKVSVDGNTNSACCGTSYKRKCEFLPTNVDLASPAVSESNVRPSTSNTACSVVLAQHFIDSSSQSEEAVPVSTVGMVHDVSLLPCLMEIAPLSRSVITEGAPEFEALGKEGFHDEISVTKPPSNSNLPVPLVTSPCMPEEGDELKSESRTLAGSTISECEKEKEVRCREWDTYLAFCGNYLKLQTPDLNQRSPNSESDHCNVFEKENSGSLSLYLPLCSDGNAISSSIYNGQQTETMPSTQSTIESPETLSSVPDLQIPVTKISECQKSSEKLCDVDKKVDERPIGESGTGSQSGNLSLRNLESGGTTHGDQSTTGRVVSLLKDAGTTMDSTKTISSKAFGMRNQLTHGVSRGFRSHSSFALTSSKSLVPPSRIAIPRTWHRPANLSAASSLPSRMSFPSSITSKRQSPRKSGKAQSTYIRKGNSLVRKPAPASVSQGSRYLSSPVFHLSSSNTNEVQKTPTFEAKGGICASMEKPGAPPPDQTSKLRNSNAIISGDCTSSPVKAHTIEDSSDTKKLMDDGDPKICSQDMTKSSESVENQIGLSIELESETMLNHENCKSSKMRKIIYVKHKSNQLVAAPDAGGHPIQNADKTQAVSSDSYYKRSKNQLIRTKADGHIKQLSSIHDDSSNSEIQRNPRLSVQGSKVSSKRLLIKVMSKPSKFSLVWRLGCKQKDIHSLQREMMLPQLFPWKRATYWRNFAYGSALPSSSSSMSMISRKLLISRKRDTVYTRSNHGFSIRKSKVLSVGGSGLKWSKSIERHSKKANAEATLAVAAVERKKREKKGAAYIRSTTKSRNRERVFHMGAVRYKMDSSEWTLQRISDEEASDSTSHQAGVNAKKTYIPRRLVIGKDEYVRIGNGNQLVRNLKKRTRILASEKVRWSLHNARLRLARKKKYCQFFTRFGKCNKDDGKCPYIHDPYKIAVCTKFLNGLCSNPDCKLTHEVIPERMPDCSYFLQGLCSNEKCHYRHVNVNPNAPVCQGFLKGYCADGDECRKKHSYVCLIFEATGSCPERSKCKLHHPKKRSSGNKRKHSQEQIFRGRYFGNKLARVSETEGRTSEKHSSRDNKDIFLEDGHMADYISLDVSDEEADELNDLASEGSMSDPSDSFTDDLDAHIKPAFIMNQNMSK